MSIPAMMRDKTEAKMKSESTLSNELYAREELEDESMLDEREVDDEDEDGDEEDDEDEDEEEIYLKAIKTVETHDRNLDLLYSGAGMYWLGTSIGWKAFRVVHARRSSSTITILGITRHSLAFTHYGY